MAIFHVKILVAVVFAPNRMAGNCNTISTLKTLSGKSCLLAKDFAAIKLPWIVVFVFEIAIGVVLDRERSDCVILAFFERDRGFTVFADYFAGEGYGCHLRYPKGRVHQIIPLTSVAGGLLSIFGFFW